MILVTVSADEHPLGHERRFWCSIKEGICKTGWFWSLACISTVVDNALEAILTALRFSPIHYSVRSMRLTWTFWVWSNLSFLYAAQVFGNDKDLLINDQWSCGCVHVFSSFNGVHYCVKAVKECQTWENMILSSESSCNVDKDGVCGKLGLCA